MKIVEFYVNILGLIILVLYYNNIILTKSNKSKLKNFTKLIIESGIISCILVYNFEYSTNCNNNLITQLLKLKLSLYITTFYCIPVIKISDS